MVRSCASLGQTSESCVGRAHPGRHPPPPSPSPPASARPAALLPARRSGIYWHTEEQRAAAEASLQRQNERLGGRVVTEVEKVSNWHAADEDHQQYLAKGGRFGAAQSAAKGCSDPIRCYG